MGGAAGGSRRDHRSVCVSSRKRGGERDESKGELVEGEGEGEEESVGD